MESKMFFLQLIWESSSWTWLKTVKGSTPAMTAACKNTHLFEFWGFFCHIKIAMYAETIYSFVPFLCIFFLPVLFDLQVHSELQSSKDQVCPHIKQVFLGVENTKCMVNHRKALMRTLLTYTITWVVCDLRSWCLIAGVLFVTFDVVSGRYRDARMAKFQSWFLWRLEHAPRWWHSEAVLRHVFKDAASSRWVM